MAGKRAKKNANSPITVKSPPMPPAVDPQLQRRVARKQRMGFILMAAVMVFALVNLGQMLLKWQADHTRRTFFTAIAADHLPVVRRLLAQHAELLHARYKDLGETPLHVAASGRHAELVEFFLQRGIDVNALDYDSATALCNAVEANDLPSVEVLIAHGVAVNRPMKYGYTPLHLAAVRDERAQIAAYLLAHGANSTALTEHGRTPLHVAARGGALAVAKLLLAHGADPRARDRDGQTPAEPGARRASW